MGRGRGSVEHLRQDWKLNCYILGRTLPLYSCMYSVRAIISPQVHTEYCVYRTSPVPRPIKKTMLPSKAETASSETHLNVRNSKQVKEGRFAKLKQGSVSAYAIASPCAARGLSCSSSHLVTAPSIVCWSGIVCGVVFVVYLFMMHDPQAQCRALLTVSTAETRTRLQRAEYQLA